MSKKYRGYMNIRQIAGKIYPNSLRKRVRFVFKAIRYGRDYVIQVNKIFEEAKLHQIIEANPKQYEKIFRPYIYAAMKIDEKMEFLREHYEFTRANWSDELIRKVYVERRFELSSTKPHAEYDGFVKFVLSREPTFANEGEIFIGLVDKSDSMVFSMNFNFTLRADEAGIVIACMKGHAGVEAKDVVRDITKDMHGLRPHHALLFAIQKIGEFYNAKSIKAIATEAHVYNASGQGGRIKTDYNGFWEEAGGVRFDGNFYSLPLIEERKSMDEIKSNKRSMYRKRFEMMDEMAWQIITTLTNA
jgi:hypothetical protein